MSIRTAQQAYREAAAHVERLREQIRAMLPPPPDKNGDWEAYAALMVEAERSVGLGAAEHALFEAKVRLLRELRAWAVRHGAPREVLDVIDASKRLPSIRERAIEIALSIRT
jgi:hypothetical protein